jgi:hypothetical protein
MLKKQLIAVLLLLGMNSFAQLNKNKIMISGRGNFYTDKSEGESYSNNPAHIKDKRSDGNIDLNVGYFLSPNFAIGGSIGLGRNVYKQTYFYTNGDNNINKSTSQNFSTGIFARYNYMINQSKFGLFFQLNNTYTWGRIDREYIYTSVVNPPGGNLALDKNHSFNLGLTPGLVYFINNRLSVETSIGYLAYNSMVTKDKPLEQRVERVSRFNADFSMATAYFGLTFYLGGKKSEAVKAETNGN